MINIDYTDTKRKRKTLNIHFENDNRNVSSLKAVFLHILIAGILKLIKKSCVESIWAKVSQVFKFIYTLFIIIKNRNCAILLLKMLSFYKKLLIPLVFKGIDSFLLS